MAEIKPMNLSGVAYNPMNSSAARGDIARNAMSAERLQMQREQVQNDKNKTQQQILIQKAQLKMQEKMKETQDMLKKIEVEGVSGGDAVKLIMNGDGDLKKITFADTAIKESKEIFEDLIVAAHNDAKSKLKKKTSEEISKVTGGIDLPPGFKLPL